ncbi:MAG: hypothetical protein KGO05_00215, partial [Chloroflexota bacterium]|nr:hypothetical protein [Chloroflexota bacterium]
MRISHISKRRTVVGALLGLAMVALLAVGGRGVASAAASQDCTPWSAGAGSGAGALHIQCTYHNATDQIVDVIPCGPNAGQPATITIIYNGQMHGTMLTAGQGAGTSWFTGTQTGTFTAVPLDATLPTYTGHQTVWFGDNNNLRNGSETSTFTVHAVGSDGSSFDFHDVAHASLS